MKEWPLSTTITISINGSTDVSGLRVMARQRPHGISERQMSVESMMAMEAW